MDLFCTKCGSTSEAIDHHCGFFFR